MKSKKDARPLREDVDENPFGISLNSPRARQPKVFIKTFGCQMNARDSEALLGLFLDGGYSLAEKLEEADIILVNTCSVRGHAEDRAVSFLGSLKKLSAISHQLLAKPVIGLIGCMARNRGEEIYKKMPHISLICGPGNFGRVFEYVEKIMSEGVRIIDIEDTAREESFYQASYRIDAGHAQVIISTGCSNYCSYCVVPYVRGSLRLRKPRDIIDEVKRNVDLGIKKVTLLGQNVNDYNYQRFPPKADQPLAEAVSGERVAERDTKISFVELLRDIEKIEGLKEIDFITSQPKNTSKELFSFIAESSKMRKHLHLPFQSGSNRILKMMSRGYTKEKYLKLVEDYKKIAGGTLSTDIIVGFPTETEEDFNQTKAIVEDVKFWCAYIFKYSPRPNTKAAELKDDVSKEDKERRHKILLDLQKKISLSFRQNNTNSQ